MISKGLLLNRLSFHTEKDQSVAGVRAVVLLAVLVQEPEHQGTFVDHPTATEAAKKKLRLIRWPQRCAEPGPKYFQSSFMPMPLGSRS